eukprot:TRINITY_DN21027_c0_g1_i2.p1 TRINITY_DN21027_c0_g1~~TRINITY_DN21027_c0_g1_i2.p1  ORF type:complete len:124 (+),score=40.25 TRINITY_DN21027_c0_g1_i2:64-435(+)
MCIRDRTQSTWAAPVQHEPKDCLALTTPLLHPETQSQIMERTLSVASKSELEEVSNEIFFLERELADFSRQYKELLSMPRGSVNEKSAGELGNISRILEEKSERLFELKKQQQIALKASNNQC